GWEGRRGRPGGGWASHAARRMLHFGSRGPARTAALILFAHRGRASAVDRSGCRAQGGPGALRPLGKHFGENRERGRLGRACAEVEADGTVDPCDLLLGGPGFEKSLDALGVSASASQGTD